MNVAIWAIQNANVATVHLLGDPRSNGIKVADIDLIAMKIADGSLFNALFPSVTYKVLEKNTGRVAFIFFASGSSFLNVNFMS
ncbi:hypothetical protein GDO86_010733 [Hymenochirus boettgeri]|uniref:Uncharacterized protein n=1 Tax=Hymenochirus boettgeri TaxID=247094 RepID=A0A8T2J8Y4_9PIPI|nr:hypothetical protein GDO86_010733 [Hymenochirus boettgeri]